MNSASTAGMLNPVGSSHSQSLELSSSTVLPYGSVPLAVAVLVDGRYVTNEENENVYQPRSEQEMEQIRALVRTAVGIDANRGDQMEVINLQFAEIDVEPEGMDERMLFGFEKSDLLDTAELLTVAIMIVLVVLLVLQPMVSRLMASESSEIDEELEADLLAARPESPALAAPDIDDPEGVNIEEEESMINIAGVDGKVKASSIKKVEEIVENYPEETVSVIRSWMTQDNV